MDANSQDQQDTPDLELLRVAARRMIATVDAIEDPDGALRDAIAYMNDRGKEVLIDKLDAEVRKDGGRVIETPFGPAIVYLRTFDLSRDPIGIDDRTGAPLHVGDRVQVTSSRFGVVQGTVLGRVNGDKPRVAVNLDVSTASALEGEFDSTKIAQEAEGFVASPKTIHRIDGPEPEPESVPEDGTRAFAQG